MKANESDEKDSDEMIDSKFAFDYSKPFTHKINKKIFQAYLLFYTKEYESCGENFSKYEYLEFIYFF